MLFPSFESSTVQGLQYVTDWITTAEEQDFLAHIEALSFSDVCIHGISAKRKVVHFGWNYGYASWHIDETTNPIPSWLWPVRERAAILMDVPAEVVEEALINPYPPGAGIGWHRDAPMFGPSVVGLSLAGTCRMRFQRQIGLRRSAAKVQLPPRSAYVLEGAARFQWQHSIPPTKEPRYSITFRTIRTKTEK